MKLVGAILTLKQLGGHGVYCANADNIAEDSGYDIL